MKETALQIVAEYLGVTIKDNDSDAALLALAEAFNRLLDSDFNRLVSVLYRLDIAEEKLKDELKSNPNQDAGLTIAKLAIERQAQKMKIRSEYKQHDDEKSDEERW